MTKKEMSKLLGYSEEFFHKYFRIAANGSSLIAKNIKVKNGKSTKSVVMDYSLEECLLACSFIPDFTKMQRQILIERFVKRNGADRRVKKIKKSKEQKSFEFLQKNSKGQLCVCATCVFFCKRKINKPGCNFSPYCNLYETFLNKVKPKISAYKDRCTSFSKS